MNERQDTDKIEQRSKAMFDDSVDNLSAHIRSRLNQARQAALAELNDTEGVRWDQWMPAGAAALAVVLAVMVWVSQPMEQSVPVETPVAAMDDLDILLEGDDLEMLAELDFYLWLEDQPELEMLEPEEDV